MSDYIWDQATQRYLSPGGTPIPRERIENALNLLLTKGEVRMRMRTLDMMQGKMDLPTWKIAMRDEIKYLHQVASSTAAGGWASMGTAEFGALGGRLQNQYFYLNRLTAQIASGHQPLNGHVLNRIGMFARAAYSTYTGAKQNQAVDWARKSRKQLLARRVLGAAEHCGGCEAEAARGWMPAELVKPIGVMECRVNCRCHIEYKTATDEAYDKAFAARIQDLDDVPTADLQRNLSRVADGGFTEEKPLRVGSIKGGYDRNIMKALAAGGLIQSRSGEHSAFWFWFDPSTLSPDAKARVDQILQSREPAPPKPAVPDKPVAPPAAPPPSIVAARFGEPLAVGARVHSEMGQDIVVKKANVPSPPPQFGTGEDLQSYLQALGVQRVYFPFHTRLTDNPNDAQARRIREHIGPQVARTLYEMAVLGLPIIDTVSFSSKGEMSNAGANATYRADDRNLIINTDAVMWGSVVMTAGLRKAEARRGFKSSPHPRGTIRHEYGHFLHDSMNPDMWTMTRNMAVPGDIKEQVQREVSRYATTNVREFVAEVFDGLMFGGRYSQEIMKRYLDYGGVIPPHVKYIAPSAPAIESTDVTSPGGFRKYEGPFKTAHDAAMYLSKLGIRIDHLEVADSPRRRTRAVFALNQMAEVAWEMQQLGLPLPKGFSLDAKPGRNTIAAFSPSTDTIFATLSARSWWTPDLVAAAQKQSFVAGFHSGRDALHTVRHEFGHWLHYHFANERAERGQSFFGPLKTLVAEHVSRYGATNEKEFVAEVFGALMEGRKFSDEIMRMYTARGGTIPDPAKLKALADFRGKPLTQHEPPTDPVAPGNFTATKPAIDYLNDRGVILKAASFKTEKAHPAVTLRLLNVVTEVIHEMQRRKLPTPMALELSDSENTHDAEFVARRNTMILYVTNPVWAGMTEADLRSRVFASFGPLLNRTQD